MNQQEFSNLYINANCLIDLAMKQAVATIARSQTHHDNLSIPDSELPSDDDLADRFANLDLSALDDLTLSDEPPAENRSDLTEQAIPQPPTQQDPIFVSSPTHAGEIDLDSYMKTANEQHSEMSQLISAAFIQADCSGLQRLIEKLPSQPKTLTDVLNGPEIGAWLELYQANNAVVSALVVEIRQLESAI